MTYFSKKKLLLTVVTAAIFIFLFTMIPFPSIVKTLRQADWMYLFLAFVVMLTFPALSALRWQVLARLAGADLSFWRSLTIIMAAWPIGAVTPAKSGDLVKILFLKNCLPYSKTTGMIIAERLMDVTVLCSYAIFLGPVYGFWQTSLVALGLLLILCGGFIFMKTPLARLIPDKYSILTDNILEAAAKIFQQKSTFFGVFIITATNWFMSFVQTWLCYKAFQADVPLLFIMAALPIAIFIGLIPVTISGMGTRDSAIIMLFSGYATKEICLAVGIMYSIFGYWLLTLIGLPFFRAAMSGLVDGIQGEELRKGIFRQNPEKSPAHLG